MEANRFGVAGITTWKQVHGTSTDGEEGMETSEIIKSYVPSKLN